MTKHRSGLGRAGVIGLSLMLSACAISEEEAYVERPVDDLYNSALDQLNNGNNAQAAEAFQEVERQHPYSQWATRGQVMAAFAFYKANDYDRAVDAARRFVDLHPGHKDVPYAYYLIGRAYYDQISDVGRDQKMTALAYDAFDELIRRFPESDYSRDARLKAELAQDHLAGKEMDVGRYYQTRGKYVAAANRFRNVVDNFQTTTQIEEALHRLTETYLALGVRDEAIKAAAVLGHNYPGSAWYQDSYDLLIDDAAINGGDGLPAPVSVETITPPDSGQEEELGIEDGELVQPPGDAQAGPI